MCSAYSKRAVLSLYKTLLRRADGLKYTDKAYYVRRIKDEFGANKFITNDEDKAYYLKVLFGGHSFFSNQVQAEACTRANLLLLRVNFLLLNVLSYMVLIFGCRKDKNFASEIQ